VAGKINGRVHLQPVVPCGQPHLLVTNRTALGNPDRLQDGVSVLMKVMDLMTSREAIEGEHISFATWNIYDSQVCRGCGNIVQEKG